MGKPRPTLEDVKSWMCPSVLELNKHLFEPESKTKAPKKSKYNNNKYEWEGIVFDSAKECNRYKHLLILLKQGIIGQLRLQVRYELNEGGTHKYEYVADFVYIDVERGLVVEDVKGYRTEVYKKKRRLMKKIHGIDIVEV